MRSFRPKCLARLPRSLLLFAAMVAPALIPARSSGNYDESEIHDLSPFRSCGLNCLFVVAKLNGIDVSLKSLEGELAPKANGESTIADLERASKTLGLDPTSAWVGMEALGSIPLPAIVQLKSRARQSDASHYVVLLGLHRRGVLLIDAPAEATLHPYSEFADDWTGVTVAYAGDRARKQQFLSALQWRGPWKLWMTRLAAAASLGFLAWLLLVKTRPRGTAIHRDLTPAGVDR